MTGCELEDGCRWPPTAKVVIGRGGVTPGYVTVVPIARAIGGIAGCADHVHSAVDGILMAGLGDPTPPAAEQIDGQARP